MAKKIVDPLLIGARMIEQFTENFSDPYFWSISLKPLPIESYLDYQAASTIVYLYNIWKRYKDPESSDHQKKIDARIIKSLSRAGHKWGKGAPQGEKDIFILLVSPLVKEKDYYSEYKELRKSGIKLDEAKREIIKKICKDFTGRKISFFEVASDFEEKLNRLNMRKISTSNQFNRHLIAYLVGYSHPDSAKVLKSRRRKKVRTAH